MILPDQSSSRVTSLVRAAKNTQVIVNCYSTLLNTTYNTKTLRTEETLKELEFELTDIKWDILGRSETKIKEKQYTVLKND